MITAKSVRKALQEGGGLFGTVEDFLFLNDPNNSGTSEAEFRLTRMTEAINAWIAENNTPAIRKYAPKADKEGREPEEKPARRFKVGEIFVTHRVSRREETLLGAVVTHCVTFAVGGTKLKDAMVQSSGDEWTPKEAISQIIGRWNLYTSISDNPVSVALEFAPGRNAVEASKIIRSLGATWETMVGMFGERGWSNLVQAFLNDGEGLEEAVAPPVTRKPKEGAETDEDGE